MPLDQIEKGLASMCPLKRAGTTSDIAKAVSLLVSPESEWINGEDYPIVLPAWQYSIVYT
jgi:3-oxoacyl-[acyl-carrier protein] reductase